MAYAFGRNMVGSVVDGDNNPLRLVPLRIRLDGWETSNGVSFGAKDYYTATNMSGNYVARVSVPATGTVDFHIFVDDDEVGTGTIDGGVSTNFPVPPITLIGYISPETTHALLLEHLADLDNPHVVTKTQVGLSDVPNVDATQRANHTGTQAISTITGLDDALDLITLDIGNLQSNDTAHDASIAAIELEITNARGGNPSLDARLDAIDSEVVGKLSIANNLSDVPNDATARTNLGLGNSATLDVGVAAGTVAAGDHNHNTVYAPIATQTEVVAARGGEGSLDARLDLMQLDIGNSQTNITALDTEITNARGASPTLDARLDLLEARRLKQSTTWDAPNLAAGANTTTTVTVTGAALGDGAAAGLTSNNNVNMELTATVTATNTVTVRLTNRASIGSVDLGSGTLTAFVFKQ